MSSRLSRDADLDDIISFLEAKPFAILLFIDGQKYAQQYADYPWVIEEAQVIEVDQEIVDHFQIGKVPQWRFYVKGSEVHHLIGTCPREEYLDNKNKVFGNLRSLK
jgi:hypothetical protein